MDATSIDDDTPEPSVPQGYVRREGKIFEVGDYPEKQFTLTEAEADAAIAAFTPVEANVEHKNTILSGKLGIMRRIWRDGRSIFGAADVPQWLDNVLKDREPTVSCEWHKQTKKLEGWGWVLDPHIGGAALFSAYAEFTRTQAEALQPPVAAPAKPAPTKERRIMSLTDKLRDKMAAVFAAGAATPDDEPVEPVEVPEPEAEEPEAEAAPVGSIGFSAPGAAESAENEDARADFTASRIINQATEAADALIAKGHVFSAGRAAAIAMFTALGFDNEANGPSVVTFTKSDGAVLNDRVQMALELFKQTPAHTLFADTLPVTVLNGSAGRTKKQTAEQEGEEQAARFNASMGATIPTPAQQQNGSTNGRH